MLESAIRADLERARAGRGGGGGGGGGGDGGGGDGGGGDGGGGGAADASGSAALGLLDRMRSFGAVPPAARSEGAPLDARVWHAPTPRPPRIGHELEFGVVTTDEVETAFELLADAEERSGGGGGQLPNRFARAAVLRRLVTSSLLLSRPLSKAEADELLQRAGIDGRGLVSCARFNERLCVLPPMPEPEEKPGCLRRCARRLCTPFGLGPGGGRKAVVGELASPQSELAELAELSEDGRHNVRDVLRPIAL